MGLSAGLLQQSRPATFVPGNCTRVSNAEIGRARGEIGRRIAPHPRQRRVRQTVTAANDEATVFIPTEQPRRIGEAEARLEVQFLDREDVARTPPRPE